jgi:hypothetical protein
MRRLNSIIPFFPSIPHIHIFPILPAIFHQVNIVFKQIHWQTAFCPSSPLPNFNPILPKFNALRMAVAID